MSSFQHPIFRRKAGLGKKEEKTKLIDRLQLTDLPKFFKFLIFVIINMVNREKKGNGCMVTGFKKIKNKFVKIKKKNKN